LTRKLKEPDDLGFEYETQLISDGITTTIMKCRTYYESIINHKWYTMKYDLKKK